MDGVRRLSTQQALAGAVLTALGYVFFFHLNSWLFSNAKVTENISWIFLPAAVRMLSVLLLGWAGVLGLFTGSLAVIVSMLDTDPARALTLGVLSSVPSLLAAQWTQRLLRVRSDLAGMTGAQLLGFGVAGGLFNSVSHTLYFMLNEGSLEPLQGLVPMFVGDTVGTVIMLYAGAMVLRLVRLPRPDTPL